MQTIMENANNFNFFGGTGVWIRALRLQSRHSSTWATSPLHFALVILKMSSHKLFAQAGLKPQAFWSQPPKQVGLQVWVTGVWINNFILNGFHK
jgi:hypothetical protein